MRSRWIPLSASLAATTAACGTSTSGNPTQCGPGTSQQGSLCVPSDAAAEVATTDSGHDGTVDSAPTDSSAADTKDASTDGIADSTTGLLDGSREAEAGGPDPCPVNMPGMTNGLVLLDCDPVCCAQDQICRGYDAGQVLPTCGMATCGSGPVSLNDNNGWSFVIRTPGQPGSDPACATACAADGFVYGFGFTLDPSIPTPFDITVGAPWEIVLHSQAPYCTDSNSTLGTNGCAFSGALYPQTVYVMTKDPNAPARNITFTVVNQPMCPPDGGD